MGMLVYISVGYFVVYPTDSGFIDGWGREHELAPFLVRILMVDQQLWPGVTWFLVDCVIFWTGVLFALGLIRAE